jgi:hypothetical protein
MRVPSIRFTIRGLMIAVVVVACLLALANRYGVIVLAFSLACLGVIGAEWLVFRGHRRFAALGFWTLATVTNLAYAAVSVAPDIYLVGLLFLGLLVIMPPVTGLGVAWARLASRQVASPRRSPRFPWLSVIALCVLPLVTLLTFWPLHVAFLAAKPALDHVADQVSAGRTGGFPQWVGPFRVARAAVDPVSGNVGLMIDPNPNGPTGLVRVRPGVPPNRTGPFGWDDLLVDLGWGWEYREAD